MRSFDYARTAPEPPEGALVFAVLLVEVVMARTYAAECDRRQRVLDGKSGRSPVQYRVPVLCLDAFSSREPVSTSLENTINEVEQEGFVTP
jgi:hypothetical protein